jgi:hypothetical protein
VHVPILNFDDILSFMCVSREVFVTSYLKEMTSVYENDKKEFQDRILKNPKMKEFPKLNKSWPLDDLGRILRDDQYYPGVQELLHLATISKIGVMLLGRQSNALGVNGIRLSANATSAAKLMILHLNQNEFRIVVNGDVRRHRDPYVLIDIFDSSTRKLFL